MFIEYSQTQSAYKCLDLKTHKIYISRHVLLDEPNTLTLSYTKLKSQTPKSHNGPLFFDAQVTPVPSPTLFALLPASTTPESIATVDASSSSNLVNPPSSSPNTCLLDSNSLFPHSSPVEQTIGQIENSQNPNAQILLNPLVQRLLQMTTWSMNTIFKPKQLNFV